MRIFFFGQWVSVGETLGYIMIIDITVPENMADSRKQVSMCMHEKKTNFLGFWVLVTLAHHLQAPCRSSIVMQVTKKKVNNVIQVIW